MDRRQMQMKYIIFQNDGFANPAKPSGPDLWKSSRDYGANEPLQRNPRVRHQSPHAWDLLGCCTETLPYIASIALHAPVWLATDRLEAERPSTPVEARRWTSKNRGTRPRLALPIFLPSPLGLLRLASSNRTVSASSLQSINSRFVFAYGVLSPLLTGNSLTALHFPTGYAVLYILSFSRVQFYQQFICNFSFFLAWCVIRCFFFALPIYQWYTFVGSSELNN